MPYNAGEFNKGLTQVHEKNLPLHSGVMSSGSGVEKKTTTPHPRSALALLFTGFWTGPKSWRIDNLPLAMTLDHSGRSRLAAQLRHAVVQSLYDPVMRLTILALLLEVAHFQRPAEYYCDLGRSH